MLNEINSGRIPYELEGFVLAKVSSTYYRPAINLEGIPKCKPYLKRLIERCWAPKPDSRPTMAEVVEELEKIIEGVPLREMSGGS